MIQALPVTSCKMTIETQRLLESPRCKDIVSQQPGMSSYSGGYSPRGNSPPSPPYRLTNFSIEQILKPEFGRKSPSLCPSGLPVLKTTTSCPSDTCKPVASPERTCPRTLEKLQEQNHIRKPEICKKDSVATPVDNSWPAWVYCTRYSDRPSSGPRSRKIKRKERTAEDKRPRTAFSNEQLTILKKEFEGNRYLSEEKRRKLASELKLNESQIKIWFQNKRAKLKKSTGTRDPLALHLMEQGLYNHSGIGLPNSDSVPS